ncbi:MAG: TolC family protein [Candidatus Zixiibacteriota bacterium]|nr:MAG: TolC family protein [candidate division Zixibacteria bacterium]
MVALYRKFLLTSCLIVFLIALAGAKTLTLDDCIELALKKNEDVIRARNMVKTADGALWQAAGEFLPSISASGTASQTHTDRFTQTDSGFAIFAPFTDTARIPPDTIAIVPVTDTFEVGGVSKSYSIGASANLTVFDGGRNVFNYLGARADKKYYEFQADASEQVIIFSVKQFYFSYLKAMEQMKISQEAVKRGEEQYKLANSRYEVGSAPKSDVLKAKVQYGNDKLGLIAAENTLEITKANLAYLIGLDVNAEVDFATDFERREYTGTEAEALDIGLKRHPGLLAAEQGVASARHTLRSAYGAYLPTLSVGVSRNWSNPKWSEVAKFRSEDASWSINTTLSVPIFSNFLRKSNVTRAKVGLNDANASYYYTKNDVALGIKEAYLDIERSREALNVAGENVLAAEEDMSLVQEKYNLGAATILELLDAQVSLVTAQNSKVEADFDYNLAVARLEKAMGIR